MPITRKRPGDRLELSRFAPSGRSFATGLALLVLAGGLYAVARGTSAFEVREVAVVGATPEVAADVRRALATARSESLLSLRLGELETAVERVPMVAAASFDRAFPHTLRVTVVPERPVGVLRQGMHSWLVAGSGRVVGTLAPGERGALPRLWLRRDVHVELGRPVGGQTLRAVQAVAPLAERPLPVRVASVRAGKTELTLVLRSGVEVRLGDEADRALKLELARRILPSLTPEETYLDVSVPARPVAGATLDSQVEVEGTTSTSP